MIRRYLYLCLICLAFIIVLLHDFIPHSHADDAFDQSYSLIDCHSEEHAFDIFLMKLKTLDLGVNHLEEMVYPNVYQSAQLIKVLFMISTPSIFTNLDNSLGVFRFADWKHKGASIKSFKTFEYILRISRRGPPFCRRTA